MIHLHCTLLKVVERLGLQATESQKDKNVREGKSHGVGVDWRHEERKKMSNVQQGMSKGMSNVQQGMSNVQENATDKPFVFRHLAVHIVR